MFLENLKVSLEGTGHRMLGAASSRDAMGYLKSGKVDLFILDDDLADMDGCELTKRIRDLGQQAPVIFLTNNITKEYVVKAMAAGVADFITKPITAANVREKVDKHLGN